MRDGSQNMYLTKYTHAVKMPLADLVKFSPETAISSLRGESKKDGDQNMYLIQYTHVAN